PIIADGYWLMLEPLAPGAHVLHTGGKLNLPFVIPHEIICNITVLPTSLADQVNQLMIDMRQGSFSRKTAGPLIARLEAALASFQLGNRRAGANQLGAFQNKVRAQVAPKDASLAEQLTVAAQQIIDQARAQAP